jgi:hypothetical protein
MNTPVTPPPLLIAIACIFVLIILAMAFTLARGETASERRSRHNRTIHPIQPATFEERVIYTLQTQTGCWGRPNDRGLIEVYKKDKLVGIVKCCEDTWEVTPALINEMAKLRVWYHVKIAYIASGGRIPNEARQAAQQQNVRLLQIPD